VFSVAVVGLGAAACGGQSRDPATEARRAADHTCSVGKAVYHHKRALVLQRLSSIGCKTDTDCDALWETNACTSTCGVAAPVAGIDVAARELKASAEEYCLDCAPIPVPPCTPPQPIQCIQGQCTEVAS
jgi:hypothetical protein